MVVVERALLWSLLKGRACGRCCRVSEEKDARGYLQALAGKMTDELEGLKITGIPVSVNASFVMHARTHAHARMHTPVIFITSFFTYTSF